MKKIDYAIMRLKEFQLCINVQKDVKLSIDNSNIILDIICDEIEQSGGEENVI